MDGTARGARLVHQRSFPCRGSLSLYSHLRPARTLASIRSIRRARLHRPRLCFRRLAGNVHRGKLDGGRCLYAVLQARSFMRIAEKTAMLIASSASEHLVIGGGPAGSMAAIRLAAAGRDVVLIERERAAHHKVCGEFLSREAVHYLDQLGIDLRGLGAELIRTLRLSSGSTVVTGQLPFQAMSLSRRALDEALLQRAQQAGCRVLRGAAVESLVSRDGAWAATLADRMSIRAQTVFLATGKHDLRGLPRSPCRQSDLIGFKLHWQLNPAAINSLNGFMDLFLFPGGYGGLSLVENGAANLCLVVCRSKAAQTRRLACPSRFDPQGESTPRPASQRRTTSLASSARHLSHPLRIPGSASARSLVDRRSSRRHSFVYGRRRLHRSAQRRSCDANASGGRERRCLRIQFAPPTRPFHGSGYLAFARCRYQFRPFSGAARAIALPCRDQEHRCWHAYPPSVTCRQRARGKLNCLDFSCGTARAR